MTDYIYGKDSHLFSIHVECFCMVKVLDNVVEIIWKCTLLAVGCSLDAVGPLQRDNFSKWTY